MSKLTTVVCLVAGAVVLGEVLAVALMASLAVVLMLAAIAVVVLAVVVAAVVAALVAAAMVVLAVLVVETCRSAWLVVREPQKSRCVMPDAEPVVLDEEPAALPLPADVVTVDPVAVLDDEGGMLYGPADAEQVVTMAACPAVEQPVEVAPLLEVAAVDYGTLSVKELVALLVSRGLPSSRASKAALVKRLVAADRRLRRSGWRPDGRP